jgi:hypothetical protein
MTEVVIDGRIYLPARRVLAYRWRRIETAPKTGEVILLCQASDENGAPIVGSAWGLHVQAAYWDKGEDEWLVYCEVMPEPSLGLIPTHWMPIPNNPLDPSVDQGP